MSISDEQKSETERNAQATTSLALGVASVVLALFSFGPGRLSALSCVGAVSAVLSFIAGARGLGAARELHGLGRKLAIAGMVAGGLGLLVFILAMGSAALQGILDAQGGLGDLPMSSPQAAHLYWDLLTARVSSLGSIV